MRENGREAIEMMRQEVVVESDNSVEKGATREEKMRSKRQRNRKKDEKSGIVKKKEE